MRCVQALWICHPFRPMFLASLSLSLSLTHTHTPLYSRVKKWPAFSPVHYLAQDSVLYIFLLSRIPFPLLDHGTGVTSTKQLSLATPPSHSTKFSQCYLPMSPEALIMCRDSLFFHASSKLSTPSFTIFFLNSKSIMFYYI